MGKIKKITENELVGGTQSTDVYPVTSVKAVYDESNERLDNILNRRGVVNISTNYNADHIAEVLTLEQAIAKVPSRDRVLGFQGNILTNNGWITYKFIGTDITQWSNIQYWSNVIDSSLLAHELGADKNSVIDQKTVSEAFNAMLSANIADNTSCLYKDDTYQEHDWIDNVALSSLGVEVVNKATKTTDYIGGFSNNRYIDLGNIINGAALFNTNYLNVAYYDANKKFVFGTALYQEKKILYLPYKYYVRICAYKQGTIHKISSAQKLVPDDNIKQYLFNVELENGYYYRWDNGNKKANSNFSCSGKIKVMPNVNISILGDTKVMSYVVYDSENTIVSSGGNEGGLSSNVIHIPENSSYMVFSMLSGTIKNAYISALNFEETLQNLKVDISEMNLVVRKSDYWYNVISGTINKNDDLDSYIVLVKSKEKYVIKPNIPILAYAILDVSKTFIRGAYISGNVIDLTSDVNYDFVYLNIIYKKDTSKGYIQISEYIKSNVSQVYCFGDSITQSVNASNNDNTYPKLLNNLIGDKYNVNNCGVSGATMANVLGRMGGIPIFLNKDFVFNNGVNSVSTTNNDDFRSAYPSVDEARTPNIVNSAGYPFLSPCLIDGYMCNITLQGSGGITTMTIELQDKDTDIVTLHKGAVLMPYGGKVCQDNIVIIMAGTNGTYTDAEDYVKQLEIAAKTISGSKYLILSQFDVHWTDDNTYQTYKTAQLAGLDRLKALENLCLERFGNKFVNMREQLVNNGLRYAIQGGYLDSSALTEPNNIDAIENGIIPFGADKTSSSSTDYHKGLLYNVHPNDAGNYAMAMIVYKALKQLYIE